MKVAVYDGSRASTVGGRRPPRLPSPTGHAAPAKRRGLCWGGASGSGLRAEARPVQTSDCPKFGRNAKPRPDASPTRPRPRRDARHKRKVRAVNQESPTTCNAQEPPHGNTHNATGAPRPRGQGPDTVQVLRRPGPLLYGGHVCRGGLCQGGLPRLRPLLLERRPGPGRVPRPRPRHVLVHRPAAHPHAAGLHGGLAAHRGVLCVQRPCVHTPVPGRLPLARRPVLYDSLHSGLSEGLRLWGSRSSSPQTPSSYRRPASASRTSRTWG